MLNITKLIFCCPMIILTPVRVNSFSPLFSWWLSLFSHTTLPGWDSLCPTQSLSACHLCCNTQMHWPRALPSFSKDSSVWKHYWVFSLSLCDMLRLCLPSDHSSRLTFSLSLTPNTASTLQPASSKSESVCGVYTCAHAVVCVYWGVGGRC